MKIKIPLLSSLVATVLLSTSFSVFATPVNINTASAEQIADALKGIGKSRAELIVAYRKNHGAFTAPEQIVDVKGVGLATFNKNKADILIK
jgi:competence protein ComEA